MLKKALAAILMVSSVPLLGHHSFAAFNSTTAITISGVVRKFEYTNPHTFVWVDVVKRGKKELWALEGQSPNFLKRRGWTKSSLKPGDKITVTLHPLRSGQPGGSFIKAVMADGRILRQVDASLEGSATK